MDGSSSPARTPGASTSSKSTLTEALPFVTTVGPCYMDLSTRGWNVTVSKFSFPVDGQVLQFVSECAQCQGFRDISAASYRRTESIQIETRLREWCLALLSRLCLLKLLICLIMSTLKVFWLINEVSGYCDFFQSVCLSVSVHLCGRNLQSL